MIRTILDGVAATAGLVGLLLAPAGPPASAACTTGIELPDTVSIDRRHKELRVPVRSDCADLERAATYLTGPAGTANVFIWDAADNPMVDSWNLYDWASPGAYRTHRGYAYDSDYDEIPFVEDTTRVKYGARAFVAATRSGSVVTVTARATYYSPFRGDFAPRNTVAKIDYRVPGGSAWRYAKTIHLGPDGRASWRARSPGYRHWRVRVPETASIWFATSRPSGR